MKILVTGAGGFLGQYFAQHLGYEVDACDRHTLNLTNARAVQDRLQSEQYDAVLHCASAGRNVARVIDNTIETNNLVGFSNLVANRHRFGRLINLATGAEFDVDSNIDQVQEDAIWTRNPIHSYGRSKNIIARQVQILQNFYNVRIFGCFDPSEADNRPLKALTKQCLAGKTFTIPADRQFDMISVRDLQTVILAILSNKINDKDVNAVYNTKYYLSEILMTYAKLHNLDPNLIKVLGHDQNSYTGNGARLAGYRLPLLGLEQSLEIYNI